MKTTKISIPLFFSALLFILFFIWVSTQNASANLIPTAATFYVAIGGNDDTGDGSLAKPWATITHALDSVPDGSDILVRPGTYTGQVRLRGNFPTGVTVRSEIPYHARLVNNDRVMHTYDGARGITIEGFEITHTGSGSGPLIIHIDGGGGGAYVTDITLRNNILHDSYDNDILKINNAAENILVEGNIFYNQTGHDEHIDVNSVVDVVIQDNIFFNDFAGSGRTNNNDTGSFIVVKDSNGGDDDFVGSEDITVRRNIFLNWEGSTGSNFVLIGEDGNPFYEARSVLVENNLLLGNSGNIMRSPFGVKGGKDITFRSNTILGNLPSYAYTMRLNTEGSNPANVNIEFFNNIYSDPEGTMGARFPGDSNDFSDTPPGETSSFSLDNNLFWNGGDALPFDAGETVNYTDDLNHISLDPMLPSVSGIVLPRWDSSGGMFADGSTTIREAFVRIVEGYGVPGEGSPVMDAANPAESPSDDILGNLRSEGGLPDIGAFEFLTELTLFGRAGDQTIYLDWTVNATLPVTTTWQIEYDNGEGDQGTIANIPQPTRSYTLTALTNFTSYTVTLEAVLDGSPFLTDTVTVTPTSIYVYLPVMNTGEN